MDPILLASFGIIGMFLMILMQVPIGISMAVTGFVGFGLLSGWGPAATLFATEPVSIITNADLAVVPLFLLMGNFAAAAGLSTDMYNISHAFLGHYRGGLAISTVGACGFFGAVCGSSPATVATFGRVALPQMIKRNYSTSFASGCIAAGGSLGAMVPPSVIIIIYAVMAQEFIITLFVAAIIPALLEIVLYFLAIICYVRLVPHAAPAGERSNWPERLRTLRRSWSAVILMLTVVGGIYAGVFTVTEAAAVGVALSVIFCLVRGKLTPDTFWKSLNHTAVTTAMIYIIIIGANIFIYFVTLTHMPETTVSALSNLTVPKGMIIIMVLIVYLILGSVFDELAAMLVTLPFVLPLIISMGYSPVWWGIINVCVIELGMITPPIGMNVFVLYGVVGKKIPLGVIYRGVMPFVLADIVRLALLVSLPILSLWLPNLMK